MPNFYNCVKSVIFFSTVFKVYVKLDEAKFHKSEKVDKSLLCFINLNLELMKSLIKVKRF